MAHMPKADHCMTLVMISRPMYYLLGQGFGYKPEQCIQLQGACRLHMSQGENSFKGLYIGVIWDHC